jgi:O-antigen ligase
VTIFFILTTFSLFITGEVMNTAAYISVITLFFLTRPIRGFRSSLRIIAVISLILIILSAIVWLDPGLHNRFVNAVTKRLPWTSTSDYYLPWSMGIKVGLENIIFGVGPKNFNLYCVNLKNAGILESTLNFLECQWHPHNLYLQIFSETGAIGLGLFSLVVIHIFISALKILRIMKWHDNIAAILAFALFFPIQTYSQAFGQSKNFFLWTVVGFILAKIRTSMTQIKKG